MNADSGIDYRYLLALEDVVEHAPAFTLGGLRYWVFRARRNGLNAALVRIDRNVFVDVNAFNRWLYDGMEEPGDYRNLRTVRQILDRSHLKESKLRYWLANAKANGLDAAVIRKNRMKLLIDVERFNAWLADQNSNSDYGLGLNGRQLEDRPRL